MFTLCLVRNAEHWRGAPIILWAFHVRESALESNECKIDKSIITFKYYNHFSHESKHKGFFYKAF